MINSNACVKSTVHAKKILTEILAHVFVRMSKFVKIPNTIIYSLKNVHIS